MDTVDRDILRYLSQRDRYFELRDVIDKSLCVKESWELVQDYGAYFKAFPNVNEIDSDFKMWQRVVRHPNWKQEEAKLKGTIVDNVLKHADPDRATFLANIQQLRTVAAVDRIKQGLTNGTMDGQKAMTMIRRINEPLLAEDTVIDMSLQAMAAQQATGGLYWRLEDLNKSLGPLRKGDFIVVAKRPEVGGTSFLCSEMSYMYEQVAAKGGNAILFNNEEDHVKLLGRMRSTALGVEHRKLMGDAAKYDAEYNTWLNGQAWDLDHCTSMTVAKLHKQLEKKQYDLIGINVLIKVHGTEAKEDHDKFQELGEECRRISQKYGPVIAIAQADPTAEGMQYIPQDRIYKSKTALQGEADGQIMIGTDEHHSEDKRFLHVAKNKLPPSACTDADKRHLKFECAFDVETGRFTSTNFKGVHSHAS